MKNKIIIALSVILATFITNITSAQEVESKANHRIVFQLTTADTLAHIQLTKQLNNILTVAPKTELEVVCHGPGLNFLIADKTKVSGKIKDLVKLGVVFHACEFSMKEKKVEKSQMVPEATYVAAGIIEIVTRQEQGWSYIKAGF